jgi:hypothetical protein
MDQPANLYLLLAVFSLGAGLVTLASGGPLVVLVSEFGLAILSAVLSERSRRED